MTTNPAEEVKLSDLMERDIEELANDPAAIEEFIKVQREARKKFQEEEKEKLRKKASKNVDPLTTKTGGEK